MEIKKVLIFTGKFPSYGDDTDGGSILISSLISALCDSCILDVVFTRTKRAEFESIAGVRRVSFETYKHHPEDKFLRRLTNKAQLLSRIKRDIDSYDMLIITHCSKAFGIEDLTEAQRSKIILFPMYLSPSYERSGEIPPSEYKECEQRALVSVGKILTPSDSEKEDMVKLLHVDEKKITVIPRGYSSLIKQHVRGVKSSFNLLYIASIKEQKNTKEAIVLTKELRDKGLNVFLNLAGSFQNERVLADCKSYITENHLEGVVKFHGVLSQARLAKLIEASYINLSVSNWETYGRGIFEGMAGVLPTVVYDRLECVKQYLKDGAGIRFVPNHKVFLSELKRLCEDRNYYIAMARLAMQSVEHLSETHEKDRLLNALFNNTKTE